ncbi:MAG: hypothetical protein Kow0058_16470 [Roseovarius sp.]
MRSISNHARAALIGLGALGPAAPALAESYDTLELGMMPDRDTCMSKAEYVLFRYKNSNGGGSVMRANWVVYGWDLQPRNQDVVIMCPIVNGAIDAFLVVHSEGTERNRDFTSEEIKWLWAQ